MQQPQQQDSYEAFGAFLNSQELSLGEMLEMLLFFSGDVLSQASDDKFDEELFTDTCKDFRNAYLICCNQQPETSNIITTH